MSLEFYVIVDKRTGLFLKKSQSARSYYAGIYTDQIGRARIFESYAKAKVGFYPNHDSEAEWDIVRMIATTFTVGVRGDE